MRRIMALAGLVLVGVVAFSVSARAQEFQLECVECSGSDSGTATGDGSGSVGTSNGTAVFTGGAVPTLQSLGNPDAADLRFLLTISHPLSTDNCDPAVPGQLGECDYSNMQVLGVRFFVAVAPDPPSPYCTQQPSPCDTIASIREGEHFTEDVNQVVVFSADLLKRNGVVLPLDGSTTLSLKKSDAKQLNSIVEAVRESGDSGQLFVGYAVRVAVVDPNPKDGVTTIIVPFSQILTIQTGVVQ